METPETPTDETFAQLLQRLKDEYPGLTDSEIARRVGVHVSTVNTWVHGKRTPRPDALRALATAFPKFTERELFAAVGRRAPGPLSPDAEERLLELFRELTAEQQQITETQMRALAEHNRSGQ